MYVVTNRAKDRYLHKQARSACILFGLPRWSWTPDLECATKFYNWEARDAALRLGVDGLVAKVEQSRAPHWTIVAPKEFP